MPGRHAAAGGGTPVAAQVLHAGRVRTIAVLGAPPAAQVACAGRAGTVAVLGDDPAAQIGGGVGVAAVAVGGALASAEIGRGDRAAAVAVLGDHAFGQITCDAGGRTIAVADVHAAIAIATGIGVRLSQRWKTGGAEQGKHQGRQLHVRVPCAVPRRAHAILRCDVGARSRNRTGMGLPPADFKSDASTSFAIRACSAAPIVAHPQGCGPIAQAGRRA
ncbi:hypothetical protein G6F65_013383 [Rhizopus arrhizus]|nr:hypothetical protein G6F65_013383 [Rhizopus arrhizus]